MERAGRAVHLPTVLALRVTWAHASGQGCQPPWRQAAGRPHTTCPESSPASPAPCQAQAPWGPQAGQTQGAGGGQGEDQQGGADCEVGAAGPWAQVGWRGDREHLPHPALIPRNSGREICSTAGPGELGLLSGLVDPQPPNIPGLSIPFTLWQNSQGKEFSRGWRGKEPLSLLALGQALQARPRRERDRNGHRACGGWVLRWPQEAHPRGCTPCGIPCPSVGGPGLIRSQRDSKCENFSCWLQARGRSCRQRLRARSHSADSYKGNGLKLRCEELNSANEQ